MTGKKVKEILKAEGRSLGGEEGERDVIDEFLEREAREAVKRAKLAKIREYELETALRLKELERKLKELESKESEGKEETSEPKLTPVDVQVAKMLKDLPEKERAEVLAYLTYLKSSGRAEPANLLIPLIIASRQANPSASPSEVIRAVNEALKTYKEATSKPGASGVDVVKEVLSTVKELTGGNIKDQLANTFLELMKNMMTNPPKGFWDKIMEDKEKLQMIRELFGVKTDPRLALELERLRQQHEREMMKLKMKMLELKHKLLSERRRERLLKSYGKRIAKAVIDGLLSSSGEIGEVPEQGYAPPKGLPKGWVSVKCEKCGTPLTFKPDESKFIICPRCGTKYEVTRRK